MKNKIIIWTLVGVSILATGVASAHMGAFGKFGNTLTAEEKTAIENMTSEERQAFMQEKRSQMEAKRLTHETVIDKLLNGEPLSTEEQSTLEEIKNQRAEMKAQAEERKVQMEVWKTLMEKKKAGETLTDEEQAKLDEMKWDFWKMHKRWWMMNGNCGWKMEKWNFQNWNKRNAFKTESL